MAEKIIVIGDIEDRKNVKGGVYITVTDQEGKKHNVFDKEHIAIIRKAYADSMAIKMVKEKTGDGKYWNVTGVSLCADELPEAPPKTKIFDAPKTESKYKADPAKTDSIQTQVALKSSVELCVAGKIDVNQILSCAEIFKRWLRGDIEVKDEAVFLAMITKYFKTEGE